MNFNFFNYLYFFSYYYLIKTAQLQFEKTWFTKIELSVFANECFMQAFVHLLRFW